jgi:hypothetical protein
MLSPADGRGWPFVASRRRKAEKDAEMRYRCAILDDYQNVALKLADWSKITGDVDITVFNQHLDGPEAATARSRTSTSSA